MHRDLSTANAEEMNLLSQNVGIHCVHNSASWTWMDWVMYLLACGRLQACMSRELKEAEDEVQWRIKSVSDVRFH